MKLAFFEMPEVVPGLEMWGAMEGDFTFIVSRDKDNGEVMASVKVRGATPFDEGRHDLGRFATVLDGMAACERFKPS